MASISGAVDAELVLRNAYLVAENRLWRDQLTGRVQRSDAARHTLAELGQTLGKQALEDVAHVVTPDPILGWHRQLAADKFDGSDQRQAPGRPRIDKALEDVGALSN